MWRPCAPLEFPPGSTTRGELKCFGKENGRRRFARCSAGREPLRPKGKMNANSENRTLFLTGGGSAGHVVPLLPIIPKLIETGWNVCYIGSGNSIERQLIPAEGVRFCAIPTGKLRRRLAVANFSEFIRAARGVAQAIALIRRHRPDVVFSKGGYVSMPV